MRVPAEEKKRLLISTLSVTYPPTLSIACGVLHMHMHMCMCMLHVYMCMCMAMHMCMCM